MAAPNTARHISHPVAGGRGTARDAAIGAGFATAHGSISHLANRLNGRRALWVDPSCRIAVRSTEAVWIGIAGAIWVVGILFAILGRVVSRERTNKDAFLSVQKFRR